MRIIRKKEIDHNLWERELYTQDIEYIIGQKIYEYDIREAGYNLGKYYDLINEKTIDYLDTLTKSERHIRIGLMMRDDRKFNKELNKCFAKMRRRFFIDNSISEIQILSIKKDAIFLTNKTCDKTVYDNVEFVIKNQFTSFHKFGTVEMYFRNKGRDLQIKGIKDELLPFHDEYMMDFFRDIFSSLEVSDNDRIINKIKKFASQYKNMELPNGYYREFNAGSMFNLKAESDGNSIRSIEYLNGFEIDHRYNYMNYILKLMQRFFFSPV